MNRIEVKNRLEYLRGEIKAERISYEELAELQSLTRWIEKNDVELLEWAGICEFCGKLLNDRREHEEICQGVAL